MRQQAAENDFSMSGRPAGQFCDPLEAAPFVQTGRLEAVAHHPDRLAATRAGLGHCRLDQRASQTDTAMAFLNPKLPEFYHPRPTVAGDGSDHGAVRINRHEAKPPAVVLANGMPVVIIQPVLEPIDLGVR